MITQRRQDTEFKIKPYNLVKTLFSKYLGFSEINAESRVAFPN